MRCAPARGCAGIVMSAGTLVDMPGRGGCGKSMGDSLVSGRELYRLARAAG